MRLLLAEDEKSLSRALCAILAKNNYSVEAVYDALDDEKFFESTRLVTSSAWSRARKVTKNASNDHENAVYTADMSKNRNVATNRQDGDGSGPAADSAAPSTDEERHERV